MIYRFYRIYDAYSIAKLSFSCLISYFSYRFITNWKQKASYLNTICQNMDSAEKHVMAHTTLQMAPSSQEGDSGMLPYSPL